MDEFMALIKNQEKCYLTDNNFAYNKDIYDENPSDENLEYVMRNLKVFNFVPTYDNECLYCDNKSPLNRCIDCHSVYFCNTECQRKAYPIHKKHCGRNLFLLCANCGSALKEKIFSCENCPVKFCSEKCKTQLIADHKEYDCEYFGKTFSK